MKNKILLISPIPPPAGGISTWTKNILKYYLTNNSDFIVNHQNSAINNRRLTNINSIVRLIVGLINSLKIIGQFKKNIVKLSPNLIHLTSSASLALFKDIFILKIASKHNIPLVIHFRFGRIPELAIKKNWEWFLIKIVIKRSNKVIVIDEKSFNVLFDLGYKNIVNIPNPISTKLEGIAKKQLTLNKKIEGNKIVFIGHVVKTKGVFELVKSCLLLPEDIELIFVGPYEESLKDKLINLGKIKGDGKWMRFLGSLNHLEIYKVLENATALALPSYTEGFPNVIIESMAMGCPVIATNVGAIEEILNVTTQNPAGICVNVKDVKELSDAIFSIITDPEKATKMGRNGLQKVLLNYTLLNIAGLYETIWLGTLKNKIYGN